MISAVIFDLDGTLVDSNEFHVARERGPSGISAFRLKLKKTKRLAASIISIRQALRIASLV